MADIDFIYPGYYWIWYDSKWIPGLIDNFKRIIRLYRFDDDYRIIQNTAPYATIAITSKTINRIGLPLRFPICRPCYSPEIVDAFDRDQFGKLTNVNELSDGVYWFREITDRFDRAEIHSKVHVCKENGLWVAISYINKWTKYINSVKSDPDHTAVHISDIGNKLEELPETLIYGNAKKQVESSSSENVLSESRIDNLGILISELEKMYGLEGLSVNLTISPRSRKGTDACQ